jgi:hypothetical protein
MVVRGAKSPRLIKGIETKNPFETSKGNEKATVVVLLT